MRPLLSLLLAATILHADGPGDNLPEKVRPVPPKGVAIPEKDREALAARAAELQKTIGDLPRALGKGKAGLLALLPDVIVFHKAVDWALRHDEFFADKAGAKTAALDVARANRLLDEGLRRAAQLKEGKPTWTTQTGLVVRGYRSKIDDSVQPYGLVVPAGYNADAPAPYRLDVWLHGRYETNTELRFVEERMRSPGQFVPRGAFVLHPFGRFSNAFKLAGEVDVLEALAHAQANYRIDEDRLVLRGFSMGGAGCWQLASHYPGKWCAAAPGAGFSETADFLKVFQKEKVAPTWYEQKLWQLYDCPNYALNFHNLPVVAYSGEKDPQKQAADKMQEALYRVGLRLQHVIGAGMGHSYNAESRDVINRRIDRIAVKGRDRTPTRVRFTTPTLRYAECHWVRLEGLGEHWEPATVDASIKGNTITVKTKNVTHLSLNFGPGDSPFEGMPEITVDGSAIKVEDPPSSDRSLWVRLYKSDKGWAFNTFFRRSEKYPGRQGPIDDAFLDRFLVVRPTGKPLHEKTGLWVKAEMERFVREWRRQMRGDVLIKDDRDVTLDDTLSCNLILWGDPSSNSVLAKVLPSLPLKWDAKAVMLAGGTHAADTHVPALIYPSPIRERKYVVLNSGLTYREYDYLNNARQHAKLPDWAVIDVRTPPSSRWPGKVVDADFFDERWKVKPRKKD